MGEETVSVYHLGELERDGLIGSLVSTQNTLDSKSSEFKIESVSKAVNKYLFKKMNALWISQFF